MGYRCSLPPFVTTANQCSSHSANNWATWQTFPLTCLLVLRKCGYLQRPVKMSDGQREDDEFYDVALDLVWLTTLDFIHSLFFFLTVKEANKKMRERRKWGYSQRKANMSDGQREEEEEFCDAVLDFLWGTSLDFVSHFSTSGTCANSNLLNVMWAWGVGTQGSKRFLCRFEMKSFMMLILIWYERQLLILLRTSLLLGVEQL